MKILIIIATFLAGLFMPIQANLNATLGISVKEPIFAAFVSFLVGTIVLFIALLLIKFDFGSIANAKSAPPIAWSAGVLGAFYIWMTIIATPILGTALTFSIIVFAQLSISVILDHFGFMNLQIESISFTKVAGLLLIFLGVIMIKKF